MANGVLGKAVSVANTDIVVYAVPVTVDFATVTIALCNIDANDATVNVAIGTSATPSTGDYIEHGAVIPADGGILERTCQVVSGGENIIVHADSSLVVVRVFGLEKQA